MVRQIIKIEEELCIGCGLCVSACNEGAIALVEGKAKLVRDDYCDGLGNCLPVCPTGAISFEMQANTTLRQWPVQIQLVPFNANYFDQADLLIAADCTAYSYRDFHSFMENKITLIGCPKLDHTDYSEKLTHILRNNQINSLTVIRMEVPCCSGLVHAVKTAILNSGKPLPLRTVILSTDGRILEEYM